MRSLFVSESGECLPMSHIKLNKTMPGKVATTRNVNLLLKLSLTQSILITTFTS
jgi:hypothetical protein